MKQRRQCYENHTLTQHVTIVQSFMLLPQSAKCFHIHRLYAYTSCSLSYSPCAINTTPIVNTKVTIFVHFCTHVVSQRYHITLNTRLKYVNQDFLWKHFERKVTLLILDLASSLECPCP